MVQSNENVKQELIKAAVAKKKAEARVVARKISVDKVRQLLADNRGKELFDGMMGTFHVATEEGKGLEIELNSTCTGIIAVAMMAAKMAALTEEDDEPDAEAVNPNA